MPEETTPTEAAPAAYAFPFDVPADLAGASDEALRDLQGQIRDHASTFASQTPASEEALAGLRACRDLAVQIAGERTVRQDRAAEASALGAEIEGLGVDDDEPEAEADAEPAVEADVDAEPEAPAASGTPATASARRPAPRVRDVARNGKGPQLPADVGRKRYAAMTAATGIPGFASGQEITSMAQVGSALAGVIDRYPTNATGRAQRSAKRQRPVTMYDAEAGGRQLTLKSYVRHQVVEIRRDFPAELRVAEGSQNGYAVADYASRERRLPGGNLIKSAELALKQGRSLTAAVGWCAPSETIYDLLELETLDGILDAPELQTTRGGWQIPIDGGPDFRSIFTTIGNSGDTHLTEDEVAAGATKVCTDIPCPPFEDVRLGVDYYCLTGGLLQRRGYPEAVARFASGAAIALAHKINAGFISAIELASSPNTVIQADPNGDDAASALLAAAELAIVDAKYSNRMGFNSTMEVVLPWWVLVPIRAALSRARGVRRMDVTDAEIMSWFTTRHAVPRFVYDWQDSFVGQATGPGGTTPLAALPSTVGMLVYPAGTWVKAVQDVVALDTIYDSTLLETNQYTAVFAEDGWAALQMGPISRKYTVPVDPSGVTGCCDLVPAS